MSATITISFNQLIRGIIKEVSITLSALGQRVKNIVYIIPRILGFKVNDQPRQINISVDKKPRQLDIKIDKKPKLYK